MQQVHVLPGPVPAMHGIKVVQAARVPASAGRLTKLPGNHESLMVKPRQETTSNAPWASLVLRLRSR